MLLGVWNSGNQHVWKWAASAGGHYWRMASDIYNGWSSVLRQFDTVRACALQCTALHCRVFAWLRWCAVSSSFSPFLSLR